MKMWKQLDVSLDSLAIQLNELELDHWTIEQIIPRTELNMTVLVSQSATSFDVREAIEAAKQAAQAAWIVEARDLCNRGKKINAIKVVRAATGMGLKEAKQYVEQEFY